MKHQALLFLAGIILATACKPTASPQNSGNSAATPSDSLPPPLTVKQILANAPTQAGNKSHLELTPLIPSASLSGTGAAVTAHHYAAKDVFFIIKPVSIQSNDGIIGLPPGSRVVKQRDGSFVGHGQRLNLTSDQYTNDLELAESFAGKDAAIQETIRSQQQSAADAAAQEEEQHASARLRSATFNR